MDVLKSMLGSAEYRPLVDDYRKKLGSSTAFDQRLASEPPRKTPKYLRIIATRDDERGQRLKAEWKGDVGVLRSDAVEQYFGSTADSDGVAAVR
jgi:hypothetical protein